MSFLATAGLISGIASVGGGLIKAIGGGRRRRRERRRLRRQQRELRKRERAYEQMDTSNPFEGLENVYEDATIDQRAAEFTAQQQQQSQADIMQDLRGAAGGSGIAGLAQAMANQGSLNAQQAAASIAQQEQANQGRTMDEASRLQGLEARGAQRSQDLEAGKIATLLGMQQQKVGATRQAVSAADQQMWGGIGDVVGGAANIGVAGIGGGEDGGWGFAMKGTPLKQRGADPTLVSGAAAASQRYTTGPGEAIDKVVGTITDLATGYAEQKKAQKQENVDLIADAADGMSDNYGEAQYSATRNHIGGIGGDFGTLSKEDQENALHKLENITRQIQDSQPYYTETVDRLSDADWSGNGSELSQTYAKALTDASKDSVRIGEAGYEYLVDGEFIPQKKLLDEINANMFDDEFSESFDEEFKMLDKRRKSTKSSGGSFSGEQVDSRIRKVVTQGKPRSLMYDDHGAGVFADDIKKLPELFNMKYSDLGISLVADEGEQNWDDNISEADQEAIIEALLNSENEELRNDLLTKYYSHQVHENLGTKVQQIDYSKYE